MLFVGLGNPGAAYASTRHNIGFMVVDALLQLVSHTPIVRKTFHGALSKTSNDFFLKPTTFMNLSGKSVEAVANFYKITTEEIVVIHDDLDLPFGAVRFKMGGGNGGHNGLKSIDAHMTKEYLRIRMGIGRPQDCTVVEHVLAPFNEQQQAVLPEFIAHACRAINALQTTVWQDVAARYSQKEIRL